MAVLPSSSLCFKPSLVCCSGATTQCSGFQLKPAKGAPLPSRSSIELPNSSPPSSNDNPSFWWSGVLSRRRSRSLVSRAFDNGSSSSGEDEVEEAAAAERLLQQQSGEESSTNLLDSLAEKVLQDEESKALLSEFATAAERAARAKQELESIDKGEKDLAEILSQMITKAVREEAEIALLVSESEQAVVAAEEGVKAAELALVTARAGFDIDGLLGRKWESYNDIDEDLERVESGKAAAVSVLAGTLASVPFFVAKDPLGIGSLLSLGGVVVSCALFGVTYRYVLRRDLGNIQLKSGAAAAFALVRGIGQVDAIQLQVGFPAQGADEVFLATLSAVEGLFIFGFSALALDYCLGEAILSPFPTKKR